MPWPEPNKKGRCVLIYQRTALRQPTVPDRQVPPETWAAVQGLISAGSFVRQ